MSQIDNSVNNPLNEQPVLAVENLEISIKANDEALVKGISFDIQAGEIFALVGESGSGKSLTSLATMRLLPDALSITRGDIRLKGDTLFTLSEQQMNQVRGDKIAMIFQEPQTSLNPVQTIGQQLKEVLKLHHNLSAREMQPKLVALLEEVGIPEPKARLTWYPHQLSGGQKQRVMIAMALACEPEVLIADEPTTALDVTIQKQVLALLNDLRQRRNLAILLITHDMGVVYEMADRVAVMQYGEILEQASRDEFFANPQHDYSKKLINSLPQGQSYLSGEGLTAAPAETVLRVDDLRVWVPEKTGHFSAYGRSYQGRRWGQFRDQQGRDPGLSRGVGLGQDHHGQGHLALGSALQRRGGV